MNDTLAPSPPEVVSPPAPPRRRSRVRSLLVMLVTLVIGVVIAALVVLGRYAPLEHSFIFGTRGVVSEEATDYAGHSSRLLTYEHGQEFWYTFGLMNTGPWGVTVTDVPLLFTPGSGYETPVQQLEVRMAPRNDDLDARQRLPLEPFSLGPDETRLIHVRARFWNCQTLGDGYMSFDSQRVRFRVLGMSHTQEITLDYPLVVRSQDVASCPPRPGIVNEEPTT